MYIDKPGIYSITNIKNNKRYIGQASSFYRRFGVHLSTLRNNKHDNIYLQNSWNKYGEESFKFEILEELEIIDKNVLAEREQYWMDYYNCYDRDYGYNINPSSTENPMLGQTHTEEARKKISEAAKGRKLSEEAKQKLIESRKNKPSDSREKQAKVDYSLRNIKKAKKIEFEYYIKDLEGNEFIFRNLSEFCRNHNLSQSHFRKMLNHGTFYKGWSGYKVKLNKDRK